MDAVLAHQGGWDEILMFLTPIALVVGTWWLLERRKARRGDAALPRGQLRQVRGVLLRGLLDTM